MIKVKLIAYTKNAESAVAAAIRQCYSSIGALNLKKTIDAETRKRLITQVLESGHTSTLEHASFTFAIEGVSRITEIQLIRHRIASYSIQSGRYVKRKDVKYVMPESIKNSKLFKKCIKHYQDCNKIYNELIDAGIQAQDARYLQPQSLETKIVVTMNARSLLNFFRERMCTRAQWEIRAMAALMLKEAKKAAPNIFQNAGPTCETEKVCWEGKMSCNKWKTIKDSDLKSRI